MGQVEVKRRWRELVLIILPPIESLLLTWCWVVLNTFGAHWYLGCLLLLVISHSAAEGLKKVDVGLVLRSRRGLVSLLR